MNFHRIRTRFRTVLVVFAFSMILSAVKAQTVHEPNITNPDWVKPYPPFRIAGNLYYVGTYDLGCYLITTSQGNILVNTGVASSAEQIKQNIETLGFKFSDTRILLTTQVHFDHVGAMAEIKSQTGAQMMVDEADAAVLADGGNSDFAFGGARLFEPVQADRLLKDGDTVQLGDMRMIMLHHPGHTKGSCSFLFTINDEQGSYRVLIANMPTIVVNKRFVDVADYPRISKDFAYTLHAMKSIHFDIWLASHASQFNLHDKHKPGDAYNPAAFVDQKGYEAALSDLEKQYDEKISKE